MMESSKTQLSKRIKDKAVNIGSDFKRKKITSLHKLFRNKGSGFYAVGYILTLLYLEFFSAIEEISDFNFSLDNLIGQFISHLISFSIETIINAIKATIWPLLVYSEFSNGYGLVILSGIFIIYYFADKRWSFFQSHFKPISNKAVNQIISNWEQQNIYFTNCNPVQSQSTSDMSDSIEYLATRASKRQLDDWRHQPKSCFALFALLQYQSSIPETTTDYRDQVIIEAIHEQLDIEMSHHQRCCLYLPLYLSKNSKHQKLAAKSYKKLTKVLSREHRKELDNFLTRLNP